jgi:hypothetical protein
MTVAFAKAEDAEAAWRVMFVKNSMSRLPLTPVVVDRGAPVFGDPPWPWFAFGWSKMVAGGAGLDDVEDIIAVTVVMTAPPATVVVAPPWNIGPPRAGEEGEPAPPFRELLREFKAPCNPWLAPKGRLIPDSIACCGAGENDPVSPTAPPPKTTTNNIIATANAFLERMVGPEARCYDEGLSERSDKSIYDENAVFVSSFHS